MGFKHEPQNHMGVTNIWLTPKYILDSLGEFDLDPCAAPEPRPWPTANAHFTEIEDGFNKEWFGTVWMNPPYGKECPKWLEKLSQHGDGIALVFARTDTKWFQQHTKNASLLLFPEKRISFCTPDGNTPKSNAGAPSVFIAYGEKSKQKLLDSKIPGVYVSIQNP